jgi:hypothetical protein
MWLVGDEPRPIPFPDHGVTYTYDGESVRNIEIQNLCEALSRPRSGVLISVQALVTNPDRDQGLLQTTENEDGFFIEYQQTEGYLVRFGMPLEDGSVARVNIKNHTRDDEFNFVALIQSSGKVRIVTDTAETTSKLSAVPIPRCDEGKIGEAAGLLPFAGNLRVSVSSDGSVREWNAWIDAYRQQTRENQRNYWFQIPLYAGLVLVLFGGVIRDVLDSLRARRMNRT